MSPDTEQPQLDSQPIDILDLTREAWSGEIWLDPHHNPTVLYGTHPPQPVTSTRQRIVAAWKVARFSWQLTARPRTN